MKRFALALLLITFSVPVFGANRTDAIVQQVEQHYNRLQTLKVIFTQIYQPEPNAPARQETGTLYLRKPGKMRWEYSSPETKLFLSDGKTVYFYVPDERHVTRVRAKESSDLRMPLRFLLGRMDLKREFRVSLANDAAPLDPGNPVLRLLPKSTGERFRELLLELDQEQRIRRLKIVESDGGITEFRLVGEIPNPPLVASMFQFKLPPGVDVTDEGQ